MQTTQKHWTENKGWEDLADRGAVNAPQLVLAFGGRAVLEDPKRFEEVRAFYPEANILCCSTAGEIVDTHVSDDSISLTAIEFRDTTLSFAEVLIGGAEESAHKGKELADALPKEGLVHVMIFSDGLNVNGTALVGGLTGGLPESVVVTGGLVGDGADFKKTVLGLNSAPTEKKIIAIGFYGTSLRVGHGSLGGWDAFGPNRLITKSANNVLYELDNKPALTLYKEYLGDEAKDLPSSGLLFPLRLTEGGNDDDDEVVRTLLAVDEEKQSMTFAGDMPEGMYATLMKANFEKLVEGAKGAAEMTRVGAGDGAVELAILISCIGRKLVLKERIEEETEAVRAVIGDSAAMTGFYSYGEVSPVAASEKQCKLHNQTMTITTMREV